MAAGGDQRDVRDAGDQAEQSQQAEILWREVIEGAAMPTGLEALEDERIGDSRRRRSGSGRRRRAVGGNGERGRCLGGRRHRHPDRAAGGVELLDLSAGRRAEGEGHNRDRQLGSQCELGVEVVVVVPRLAELTLDPDPRRVLLDHRRVGRLAARGEDIQPERPLGQPPQLRHLRRDRLRLPIARRQKPEPTRIRHRRRELRRRDPARHRRLHNRPSQLPNLEHPRTLARPSPSPCKRRSREVTPSAEPTALRTT